MAALSYAFDPSAGETPDSIARRRETANLLAARIFGRPPQNVGEGLSAIGQALIARKMSQDADASQAAGMASVPSDFGGAGPSLAAGIASKITGQPQPATYATGDAASGGQPQPVSPGTGDAASAISGIESGGRYDLLGPVTKTGDRAYGKYQVMGANVPEWTQAALGKSMTPQEFLASPQAQDTVFQNRFGQYAQKYGPEGAARAWFAGEGGMNNPNARDQLGTTVQAYADKFNRAYGTAAPTAAPTRVAQAAPQGGGDDEEDAATPAAAKPTQGALPTAQDVQPRSQSYGGPFPNVSTPDLTKQALNPWVPAATRQVLSAEVTRRATMDQQASDPLRALQIKKAQKDLDKPDDPTSVQEYEYGLTHPDFVRAQLEKTKAGAAQLNNQNNIDMNSGQTYDKQLAEGLGKSHAALANGVEDAQTRARDIAAMQGAVDAIQKNGGTTGGLAPAQRLEIQKSINAGAAALGIEKPFSESDLSDKEFLTKFNRSMAGAQAKNAVGSRVTNFEMSNFLKANPGLDMTLTGNQRLLGIQAQLEQRNIALGNAVRDATASAISNGKKIDPVTVQKLITNYDEQHHIQDPITGQDLTQSYTLPEFQNTPTNKSMSEQHEQSIQAMPKTIGGKTYYKGPDGHWYVK